MITNLFSVFDPSIALFSSSWIILPPLITFLPLTIWNSNNPSLNMLQKVLLILLKELNFTLNNGNNSQEILLILIFILIILVNFSALYPQNFSLTSHIIFTIPLSLLTWLTIASFGWTNNTNHIISHLLPQGTPVPLASFIVLIELISNLIRPITLCVRLTANLIAGHLLITLLGNSLTTVSLLTSLTLSLCPIILTVLETAVAIIQAYVFITLATLYITEIN